MGAAGLKRVSVVLIVFGVLSALVSLLIGFFGGRLIEAGALAMVQGDLIGSVALSLAGAGLELAAGITGLRLARRGSGAVAGKAMGIVLLIFQMGSSVLNLLGGDRSAESVVSMLLCILITVLYLVGMFCVSNEGPKKS